jgi:hypothetical protein
MTVSSTIPNILRHFLELDIAFFQVEICNTEVRRHPENAWRVVEPSNRRVELFLNVIKIHLIKRIHPKIIKSSAKVVKLVES